MSAALTLDRISVALGGRDVVRDVTLALGAARFVALLGPNGAGKTTLLKAMAGLLPARGIVRIGNQPLAALSRKQRAQRMGYLPQGHQVHWPLSTCDVVALGRFPHGLADPAAMRGADATAVNTAMMRTDTTRFADQAVTTLSGGERARVMLARVLAGQPEILLVDEPTASLDPRYQITVMQDLRSEARRGALVVAVTHDIALASRLADEIMLMHEGLLVARGAPADVLTDEHLAKVYGITALRQTIDGEEIVTPWGLA
ncbi:MAG: ABC transporter ATP-binding protein [Hyphomicrobiales bacterium]|uniref:ABC transporter ATP-binding protein n=1 Tax=Rhabdaerophilum calidifontis TaxID=2604328 RepID=UPI00123AD028|nr:ABC transporter ATP-binding protein [Rhabdaerophilum calidifontis]MCA1951518.1 ABC transporter ATP-binding protein [Hyphomicrobiales bacterium]MCA1998286.1 ABC transporter ATP-binding protein [Hyphomicrobiales bacterium]